MGGAGVILCTRESVAIVSSVYTVHNSCIIVDLHKQAKP